MAVEAPTTVAGTVKPSPCPGLVHALTEGALVLAIPGLQGQRQ